ncbi:MAG: peptidoglycan-binding protein [Candidatus Omnitrophica bacterium]|nr:peptidoglycan-binding protein [Candidatus Omnitrophota bacterium]
MPVAEPAVAAKGANNIIRVVAAPEQIQAALKAAGFYNGKVDGKIGAGTRAAVIQFQRFQGLDADGVIGRKTWDILKTYLK